MLSRAVRVMVPDADFSIEGAPSFSDEEHISNWALDHVKYMSKIGVIKGSEGNSCQRLLLRRKLQAVMRQQPASKATLMAVRIYEKFKDE